MKLILTYVWFGVGFIWLGALGLQHCSPDACAFAFAGGASALVMFITAGQISSMKNK